jgi:hypothetical protein
LVHKVLLVRKALRVRLVHRVHKEILVLKVQ